MADMENPILPVELVLDQSKIRADLDRTLNSLRQEAQLKVSLTLDPSAITDAQKKLTQSKGASFFTPILQNIASGLLVNQFADLPKNLDCPVLGI